MNRDRDFTDRRVSNTTILKLIPKYRDEFVHEENERRRRLRRELIK